MTVSHLIFFCKFWHPRDKKQQPWTYLTLWKCIFLISGPSNCLWMYMSFMLSLCCLKLLDSLTDWHLFRGEESTSGIIIIAICMRMPQPSAFPSHTARDGINFGFLSYWLSLIITNCKERVSISHTPCCWVGPIHNKSKPERVSSIFSSLRFLHCKIKSIL